MKIKLEGILIKVIENDAFVCDGFTLIDSGLTDQLRNNFQLSLSPTSKCPLVAVIKHPTTSTITHIGINDNEVTIGCGYHFSDTAIVHDCEKYIDLIYDI